MLVLKHHRISSLDIILLKQKGQFWSCYFVFIKKTDGFSSNCYMKSPKFIYFYQ